MFLVCNDKEVPISLEIDNNEKILSMIFSNNKLNIVNIPEIFFQDVETLEYSIFVLKHYSLKENSIYEVYLDENGKDKIRAGYLIPILAIESIEHDFKDKIHFWRACNTAIRLLFGESNQLRLYPNLNIQNSYDVMLSELFGPDTAILVLKNSNFDIKKVFSSLVSRGFIFQESDILSVNKYYSYEELESGTKKFYIKCMSNDLDHIKDEIYSLLQLYSSQENNVFRFFILYQIIEVLMQCIFDNTKQELLNNIRNSDINGVRKAVSNYTDESKRIASLVHTYSNKAFSNENTREIKTSCCDFLKIYNPNYDTSNFNFYIYDMRNRLFHNFRTHNKEIENKLGLVVNDFVKILPKILYYYSNK